MRHRGTIEWYNTDKKYGFLEETLTLDAEANIYIKLQVFFHLSSFSEVNEASLLPGKAVEYQITENGPKRYRALNCTLV